MSSPISRRFFMSNRILSSPAKRGDISIALRADISNAIRQYDTSQLFL